MRTIADAHRDTALALALANQGEKAALLNKRNTEVHVVSIHKMEQRLKDLAEVEDAPNDVEEFVIANLQRWHDNLTDDNEKWKMYVTNAKKAVLVFGIEIDHSVAVKTQRNIARNIKALEAVCPETKPAEVPARDDVPEES